ncbi:MAG: CMD domain protein [Chloroflexia bacterium]|nr:CMD domain protein [Chloroflexia bacterium]
MTATNVQTADVVNAILGINEHSPIAELRNRKPDLVRELQDYYLSLFEPTASSADAFPVLDRYLVAARVASHTGSTAVADWYGRLAAEAGAPGEALSLARDVEQPVTEASAVGAALRHADLLTTRPADARKTDLQALKDAGFTPAGIVSLSQTIAFVSYQLRLIAGLRAYGGRS